MSRNGLAISVVGTFVTVSALLVGCNNEGTPPEQLDAGEEEIATTTVLSNSAGPGGGWTPTIAANGRISVCHSAGKSGKYVHLNVSSNAANAHLGDPATGRGGHSGDFRSSELTPCPPPSTPGTLQVCKVAGSGITAGTSFGFTLAGNGGQRSVTTTAGAAPAGTCAQSESYPVGTRVTVTETAQQGVTTSAITVAPGGAQVGTSDLAGRSATVIVGVGTTTVTFTNTGAGGAPGPTGTLVICKVGGTGITAGTSFTFQASGQTSTVAAGAAPNGTCGTPLTIAAGSVTVTENAAAGTIVQAITATPAAPTNVSLPGRSATVQVVAGQETRVTYTNIASTSANSGTLVICKVGGTGVTAGTSFGFTVAGQTATVAAGAAPTGTCSTTPLTVAAGSVTVTENAATGVSVSGVTASGTGGANALVSSDLAARSATVTITAGQETRVTFTNTASQAGTGTLVICKVAGTGLGVGSNFNFTVGSQSQTVAAGAAPNGTCGAPLTLPAGVVTVTEAAATGTSVSNIVGNPATTSINVAERWGTILITAGQESRITFTNVAP